MYALIVHLPHMIAVCDRVQPSVSYLIEVTNALFVQRNFDKKSLSATLELNVQKRKLSLADIDILLYSLQFMILFQLAFHVAINRMVSLFLFIAFDYFTMFILQR